MTLTITDLFAGAGGSSTGAIGVPGVSVRLAANHWQKAVDAVTPPAARDLIGCVVESLGGAS